MPSERQLLPGDKLISPYAAARAKFSRGRSWIWDRIKNDPEFPKPIAINGGRFLIERELDEYIAKKSGLPLGVTIQREPEAA